MTAAVTMPDERVRTPAVFVVELFLPSEARELRRAMHRHNWHETADIVCADWDLLAQVRSGTSRVWWPLGTFAARNSPLRHPDTRRKRLPAEFDAVEWQAVQIGDGITAVVATFYPALVAAESLDKAWLRRAQLARQSIHDSARRFVATACPGFFAANSEPQPLIDLLFLTERGTERRVSPELPAMNLQRMSRTSDCYLRPTRTWALWGEQPAIADDAAMVDRIRKTFGDSLLQLSVSEMLCVYHSRYAQIRDRAPRRRGRLRMSHMREQRSNLLVLSLNVRTTERAIRQFNESRQPRDDEGMAADQAEMLEQLKSDDEQYRDILSTALSLTSSMQSLRASRVARWIAVASLATSFLLLMLTDEAQHPRITALLQWITSG